MKKSILLLAIMLFIPVFAANAEYISPQPELTVLEAMGIDDFSEVKGGYIFSVEKELAMDMSPELLKDFYDGVGGVVLTQRVTKNPFCGLAVVLITDEGEKTYFFNSGVQVGIMGESNFMCYSADVQNDVIDILYTVFMSSPNRYTKSVFTINTDTDYLLLPTEKWAVTEAKFAAANSLLPYKVSEHFGKAISREQFCILVANYIKVCGNYNKLEDYFADKNLSFASNYFSDTEWRDNSINMLHALGVINGKGDGMFCPDDALSREQAAVILKNAAVAAGKDLRPGVADFKDMHIVSAWAIESVNAVGANGVMSGADGNFNPSEFLTTEQAVAGINKLFRLSR